MKTKGFWRGVFSDWPAKVLSLGVALLLFFFLRLSRLETRVITVPLQVQTNGEYAPSSQYPRTVKLTLRGESAALFQLQEEDFVASIDLREVSSPGLAKSSVDVERKGAALQVDPLEIAADPVAVSVTMDRKSSRVVPVTPTFHGFLDPGYELSSFDLAPAEVTIEGPAGVVEKIADVTTEPIELSGRRGDFAVKAKLLRSTALVSIPGADSAEFRGSVMRTLVLRSFPNLQPAILGLSEGLALAEPVQAIHLGITSQSVDLKQFTPGAESLFVDLSQARKAGTYSLPVQVRLPEGVTVESLEPPTVTVVLKQRTGGVE